MIGDARPNEHDEYKDIMAENPNVTEPMDWEFEAQQLMMKQVIDNSMIAQLNFYIRSMLSLSVCFSKASQYTEFAHMPSKDLHIVYKSLPWFFPILSVLR